MSQQVVYTFLKICTRNGDIVLESVEPGKWECALNNSFGLGHNIKIELSYDLVVYIHPKMGK